MPLIQQSCYIPPFFMTNGHLQTIFPTLFRKIRGIRYFRERIDTPDGDFLDLDWLRTGSSRIAILSHGLEGHSRKHYVLGMAKALRHRGWDVLAWNFRGCSGEPNKTARFYHSGASEDLLCVTAHVLAKDSYREVALIGFSMGGNITLKFLGESSSDINPAITRAVVFSVPCDLSSSSDRLSEPMNRIYLNRFLRSLRKKLRAKMRAMPGLISDSGYETIRTFRDFDNRYTAPLHGFKDALEYYRKASCKPFIEHIRIPTLLVNAKDDPFLTPECYPIEEAARSRQVFLEIPNAGGHVGFVAFNRQGTYWPEARALAFLNA